MTILLFSGNDVENALSDKNLRNIYDDKGKVIVDQGWKEPEEETEPLEDDSEEDVE